MTKIKILRAIISKKYNIMAALLIRITLTASMKTLCLKNSPKRSTDWPGKVPVTKSKSTRINPKQ
jgi:hypothetical protein